MLAVLTTPFSRSLSSPHLSNMDGGAEISADGLRPAA